MRVGSGLPCSVRADRDQRERQSHRVAALDFGTVAMPDTPAALLAAALRSDPARPFLTFYDDATGERVELSLTTLDNWVAKTANLLQDELGTQPGERVAILLPPHWLGAVWPLAAWSAGLVVDLVSPTGADVVVVGPDQVDEAMAAGGRDTVALALRPLGGAFTTPLAAGVLDYGVEVPGQADDFRPYAPVEPDAPAITVAVAPGPDGASTAIERLTGHELAERAVARAGDLGLGRGGRLLTDANPSGPDGYLEALLAPLAVGASVVLVRNLDPAMVERRAATEKVTARRLRSVAS
jgi:uncharacterized protein (TIGR03089 family)